MWNCSSTHFGPIEIWKYIDFMNKVNGTVDALHDVASLIRFFLESDDFLVLNGDTFCDFDLNSFDAQNESIVLGFDNPNTGKYAGIAKLNSTALHNLGSLYASADIGDAIDGAKVAVNWFWDIGTVENYHLGKDFLSKPFKKLQEDWDTQMEWWTTAKQYRLAQEKEGDNGLEW